MADSPRTRILNGTPGPQGVPDRERLQRAAREFIRALGVLDDPRVVEASARRMTDAWAEDILGGYRVDPEAIVEPFPAGEHSGMVVVRDVEFTSFCVHHLLPFVGRAHLAYLPGSLLTGISKLARLVDALARRLQIQEQMTGELVRVMEARLQPRGAGALIEAEHLCMTARGIKSRRSRIVTTAWSGVFESHPEQRRALLELLGVSPSS